MCNPRHHRSRRDDWSQTRWVGSDADEWRRPRAQRDVWSAHWGPPEPWVSVGWGPPGRRPARDRFETDPDLRASDDERERLVTLLRGHAQDGRLDADELEERIGAAYAARTRGELGALLRDLPAEADVEPEPVRVRPAAAPSPAARWMSGPVLAWIGGCLLFLALWALTGAGYFWPIWPILGWGVAVLRHAPVGSGGPPASRGRPRR